MNERTSRRRLGVTAAVTVVALVAFAAIGGTGLAGGPGSGKSQYAPGYQNGQKITICHKGKTIRVALVSWKAHKAHGDTLGACAQSAPSTNKPQSGTTQTSTTSSNQTTSKGKGKGKGKK